MFFSPSILYKKAAYKIIPRQNPPHAATMATPSLETLAKIIPTTQPIKRDPPKTNQFAHTGVFLVKKKVNTKNERIAMETTVPIMQIVGLNSGFPKTPNIKPTTMRSPPNTNEYLERNLMSGFVSN